MKNIDKDFYTLMARADTIGRVPVSYLVKNEDFYRA